MYFPGDPLFVQDPIFNSVPDPAAGGGLISTFDLAETVPEWALAFRVRHRAARPRRDADGALAQRRGSTDELAPTPSQTVGPYFAIGLPWDDGPFVVPEGPERSGCAGGCSTAGEPVPDALIETWQADPEGGSTTRTTRAGPGLRGFAGSAGAQPTPRAATRSSRSSPAWCRARTAPQAPHIDVSVFARGLLNRLVTRIYFPEDEAAHASDPVLAGVPDLASRATLVAERSEDGYRFDIRLQGDRETAFFSV